MSLLFTSLASVITVIGKNQNRRSMMGLTSHLSCVYDTFSSYRVSFSLMTIMTVMVLVMGYLVRALFHFPLEILLVVSVEYFPVVASVKYFQLTESQNPLVMAVEYFPLVVSVEYFQLVESENYFELVESQN